MDAELCSAALSLFRDLMSLLREREVEQALERVRKARCDHAAQSYEKRADVISHVNVMVHRLRGEREKVRAMVMSLPDQERLFAEAQIEPMLDEVFNKEIAELKAAKRRYSKAR